MTNLNHTSASWKPFPFVLLLLAALFAISPAVAQSTNDGPVPPGASVRATNKSALAATGVTTEGNPGLTLDGYIVKQTAEFGARIADFSGNEVMWDTFVNLGSGPRLLEYSLNLHSEQHKGLLFDDFSFSNFGYGGDPNDVSRLQFSKGAFYDFDANFRRDRNVFDYNLLANPLNPSTSVPNVPILESPHAFYVTRRMSDFNLRLLPLSRVRFRLGYSRNVEEGISFSSMHEGTEALLAQPTRSITDNYRFGVSLRLLQRTFLNYDQFYIRSKGDTTAQLNSLPYLLAGGIPVDLGLSFNTAAGQPCAAPILSTGFVNPACNAFFSYSRFENNRNSFPTEQASFQSSYFAWLDLSSRFSYSKASNTIPTFDELFSGLITRTRQRSYANTGSISAERLSLTGDFAATVHLTDKLRLLDIFRYDNFRIPGSWALDTPSLFGATLLSTPNSFDPATCPPPFTAATCPQHSASSSPDIVQDVLNDFLRHARSSNTIELEYDITPRIMSYLGYRYEHRETTHDSTDVQLQTFYPTLPNRGACAGLPLVNGVCTTSVPTISDVYVPINTNALLAGLSARLTDSFRVRFDTEFQYADNAYTRISPRHAQLYRLRATYKPADWININGVISILENRDTALAIGNLQHNRSYSLTSQLAPQSSRWGVDLTYSYSDVYSQTNICYAATPAPVGSLQLTCAAAYLFGISNYSSLSNFGSGSFFFKPVPRFTAWLGYSLTSATGNSFFIDPLSPTGPLTYRYHLPLAAFNFDITKGFAFKSSWNYYDYHEYSDSGPTLPRNFRGNVVTLSIRYAF